jgi:hypothetical protein
MKTPTSKLIKYLIFSAFAVVAISSVETEAHAMTGITVYSLTDGASIVVDGQTVGTVPMEDLIPMEPGRHTLKVTKPGFSERAEIVDLREDQELEFEIDLFPYAGIFKVDTNATDAALWLDGKPFAPLPFDGEIPMGSHKLKVVAPGFLSSERTLKIEGGRQMTLRFDLEAAPIVSSSQDSVLNKWWFWTAAGAVVLGGVTGAVLATSGETPLPSVNGTLTF